VLRVLFVWGCGGWYGKVFVPFIFTIGGEKSACNADIANKFSLLGAKFSFKQQFYSIGIIFHECRETIK
jgi:putative lipoprotein (fragment)